MTDTPADDQTALLAEWVAALVAELSAADFSTSEFPGSEIASAEFSADELAEADNPSAEYSAPGSPTLPLAAPELSAEDVDVEAVLALAGVAAHSVVRPAAPLTTFVVGYAAGLAAAHGADPASALARATEAATAAANRWQAGHGA